MSVIALIFSWTKLPQWALEIIVIAGLAGGFWWYHHHVYTLGLAAQQAADNKASAAVIAQAAAATKAAQDAANRAQESYREEVASNAAAAAARPLGPVRLCLDSYARGGGMPEAGAPVGRAQRPSAGAGRVSGVPGGDPRLRQERPGPDLEELLGAWAEAADRVSATLRECKAR
jgi:hypothetical protein